MGSARASKHSCRSEFGLSRDSQLKLLFLTFLSLCGVVFLNLQFRRWHPTYLLQHFRSEKQ